MEHQDMTEDKKTTNLDELKNKLYEAFDLVLSQAEKFRANTNTDYAQAEGGYINAAATIADSISKIEREQREAKDRGYTKLDKN
jgi:hypothetical protein